MSEHSDDSERDPVERVIRSMDGEDPAAELDRLRREPPRSGQSPPEGFEEPVEFDTKVRRSIPPVEPADRAAFDRAFERARIRSAVGSSHRPPRVPWLGMAAATAAIAAAIFLVLYLPGRGPKSLTFDFTLLDTTRSASGPTERPYRLQATLGADAYWYVIELADGDRIQILFPFYDSESDRWDYLGHEGNHFEAGTQVLVPHPDSTSVLVASGEAGATEPVFGLASREPVSLEALRTLADELQAIVLAASEAERSDERIVSELRRVLDSRFDAVRMQTRTYE